MKKLILLMTALLLFVSLGAIAYAGNTYDVPELSLSIDPPDDWLTITRNPLDNKTAETMLQISSIELIDFLTTNAIYIDFLNPNGLEEIVVTMVENDDSHDLISVNQLSDRHLEEIAESIMGMTIEDVERNAEDLSFEGILPNEVAWTGYSVYEHEQAKFIKMYHTKSLDGIQFEGLQYYTVQNGQMINVTVTAYTGELTEALETTAKELVDSIVFSELAEGKKPVDYYTLTKNILIAVCIIGIIIMTPTFLKIRKQKMQENTPLDKE